MLKIESRVLPKGKHSTIKATSIAFGYNLYTVNLSQATWGPHICVRILEIEVDLEEKVQHSSGVNKITWNILGNWAMADSRQVFHTGIWASLSSGFSQGSDPVFSPQDLGKSLLPNLHIQPADPQGRLPS